MNFKTLILLAASAAILLFFAAKNIFDDKTNKTKTEKAQFKRFKIAILTPATHPSLQQIENGFCKTINKIKDLKRDLKTVMGDEIKHKYDISVFNANGDKILLHAQAEEIISQDFDLIFTIGTTSSQLCKELCIKKGKHTPIVFGAVADPVRIGLVKSLQKPEGCVTGAVEAPDYKTQLNLLLQLKPNIKNILLIYNPSQGSCLERDKDEIEQLLSQKKVNLISCEIYNTNEIQGKLAGLIQSADVVLILKDNTVVSGIDGIIKLCNLYHVTLMATDLDSGDKGAALSFGVQESAFGEQAAMLARKILEEGANPADLPCITDYKNELNINRKTMNDQGLVIPENMLHLLKYTKTI
jgi:putative ABC transport system substrate-binding protein